jgi:hypothetical protein
MKRLTSNMAMVGASIIAAFVMAAAASAQQASALELRSENAAGQHHALRATPLELVTEHSAGQHVAQGIPVAAPESAVPAASVRSFSWRDAGIGAGASLFLMLVVAGTIVVQRRMRPVATNG